MITEIIFYAVVAAVGFAIGFRVGMASGAEEGRLRWWDEGRQSGRRDLRDEAISLGHGEWRVDAKTGETSFHFRNKPEAKDDLPATSPP